jgi:hypothetical protein
MSDDDLIRRGDAIVVLPGPRHDFAPYQDAVAAIRALPAVQPRVKPLVWLQHPHRLGELFADAEFGAYSVSDPTGRGRWQWQWRRHLMGALLDQSNQELTRAFPTRGDAIAAAEGHRKVRILSALDLPAPKPDPFFTWPPVEPQPDAAAIRKAALREAADSLLECSVWCDSQERTDDGWRNGLRDARKYHMARILAMIDTGKEVVPVEPNGSAAEGPRDIGPGDQAVAGAAGLNAGEGATLITIHEGIVALTRCKSFEDACTRGAEWEVKKTGYLNWHTVEGKAQVLWTHSPDPVAGAAQDGDVDAGVYDDDPDEIGILQARVEDQDRTIADLTRQLQGQPRRQSDVVAGAAPVSVGPTLPRCECGMTGPCAWAECRSPNLAQKGDSHE